MPAPGGLPVAAVVTRLLQRHPEAVREGWTRLLGPDRRLFHVPLDAAALAALHDAADSLVEREEDELIQYDSAVEAAFARAFHAAAQGGRLGVARGWTMEREPRAVLVEGSVFLPDFSFRRGEAEVFCEVVGYYTEDYLTRKRRKLAYLQGRIALLLVVDQDLAPLFADAGFPMVTYKAGRQIGVAEVVQTLDALFDPFERRRARAVRDLATLCREEGPRLTEEEICAAIGCAGLNELAALWSELTATASTGAEVAPMASMEAASPTAFRRRYVPGYGLVSTTSLAQAQAALGRLLDEAGGNVSLDDTLACCAQAGVPDADDALIAELGGVVVRSGLFGEARVYRKGAEADSALAAALPTAPAGRRRRRS